MAKTIKITEGGVSRTFTTSKLKTTLQDGVSSCEWIPYDERFNYVNIGTKVINYSGTYDASSDHLDGYSQVTVDVQGGYDEDLIYAELNVTEWGS